MLQMTNAGLVLFLTVLSGLLDARGFVYASRAWPGGVVDMKWAGAAVLAFVGGLSCYVFSVRFMQGFGVTGVALQSGIWFVVTAAGVALMDGSILNWSKSQQAVALGIAVAMCWLVISTSASDA